MFLKLSIQKYKKKRFYCFIFYRKNKFTILGIFNSFNIKVYAQKKGWKLIRDINDLPTSHREGSIFIYQKNNWSN